MTYNFNKQEYVDYLKESTTHLDSWFKLMVEGLRFDERSFSIYEFDKWLELYDETLSKVFVYTLGGVAGVYKNDKALSDVNMILNKLVAMLHSINFVNKDVRYYNRYLDCTSGIDTFVCSNFKETFEFVQNTLQNDLELTMFDDELIANSRYDIIHSDSYNRVLSNMSYTVLELMDEIDHNLDIAYSYIVGYTGGDIGIVNNIMLEDTADSEIRRIFDVFYMLSSITGGDSKIINVIGRYKDIDKLPIK